jgi:hypothetical protein
MEHPNKLIFLLEKELLSFASDNNARKMLSKYSISLEEEKMQKALVIWSTEFRHVLERWRASLPEDAVEADYALSKKKGSTGPRQSKKKQDVEVIEDTDLI